MESPDRFIVLKLGSDENSIYKVFATWYGGYLSSDSWKMNSGISKVEEDEQYIRFYGYSGSCYQCIKGTYGTNMYSQGILNTILENTNKVNISVTIMSEDTNWLTLIQQ